MANQYNAFRVRQTGRIHVVASHDEGDDQRELWMMAGNRPKFFPKFQFSRLKRRVDKTPTPGLRNPVLTMIVRDFSKAVGKGEAKEFADFVMNHPLAGRLGPLT